MSRIVVLHPGDDMYGIDRVALQIVRTLRGARHDVSVVLDSHNPGSGWLSRELAREGVQHSRLALGHLARARLKRPTAAASWAADVIGSWAPLLRATRGADLVYVNGFTLAASATLLRGSGKPVLWHLHEIPPAAGRLNRLVRSVSNIQVCVSHAVQESYRLTGAACRVVYNGVDAPPPRVAPRKPGPVRFGIVARINAWKGHLVLLDAFARLVDAGELCHLVIAGGAHASDTSAARLLESRLQALPSRDSVTLLAETDRTDAVLTDLDVLVAPSLRPDPFPLTVLEAMAAGVPVIATAVGGHPEAIETGVSGLLVPPNDVDALADAMRSVLRDEDLRRGLGASARDRAVNMFTTDRFARGLAAAVQDAIQPP